MKLFIRDQEMRLSEHLLDLKSRALSFPETDGLPQRTIQRRITGETRDLASCNLDFLFAYEVFPRSILKFFGEWQLENRAMRAGDVIVQQAQVPPDWGLRFIFGVRVLSVYREDTRAGFSYGTLPGHPEVGTNEFSFSLMGGAMLASVRTIAKPVLPLSRIHGPLFVNRYISFCNRAALRRMEQQFVQFNGGLGRATGGAQTPASSDPSGMP